MAIRNRVLNTIRGTWGGPRTSIGHPAAGATASIRIATWSFKDWDIAKALVAARDRGVSVQVVAARSRQQGQRGRGGTSQARSARKPLPARATRARSRWSASPASAAARAADRGGTPHAKYFLFDKVGRGRQRYVIFQTSMNLTRFAYTGQWNQAQVMKSAAVYNDFLTVFRQARSAGRSRNPTTRQRASATVVDYFFPDPGAGRPGPGDAEPQRGRGARGATAAATATGAPRSGSSSTPCTATGRVDRQAAARACGTPGCDVTDDLRRSQPSGAADHAQQVRPRPDPDAAVGDQERQRRDQRSTTTASG